MPKTIQGSLSDQGGRYVLLVSRFNDLITSRLLEGAVDALARHGVDTDKQVTVVWVPGCYEMPVAARAAADSGRYDAVVALGCVIRGGTAHFDFVAGEASKGLAQVAQATGVPVSFGVLTTNTLEQALDRAGGKMGNKGGEAALAALEMVGVLDQLRGD